MRTNQLFAAVVALAFATACENKVSEDKASSEDQAPTRAGLQAQIKAQTTAGAQATAIDGGVASLAAAGDCRNRRQWA